MILDSLNDSDLVVHTKNLVGEEKQILQQILEHLREIERRRLFASRGFSSLHDFCTKVLGYSESAATRRINSMRLIRALPEAKESLNQGKVTLSTVSQLEAFIKKDEKIKGAKLNHEEKLGLLKAIENKSQRECEKVFTKLQPELVSKKESLRPMTEELSKLMIMVSQRFLDKLREYKDLHSHSSNSTVEVLERALDVALDQAKKKRQPKKEITHCHTVAVSPGVTRSREKTKLSQLSDVKIAEAKFREQNLREQNLREQNLREQNLAGETLKEETPKGETLRGETLRGETLGGETLGGETLKEESLTEETPRKQNLTGETPREQNLAGETLREETLREETLRGETLGGETLRGETLRGETLRGETLRGETLRGETLRGETLRECYLTNAKHPESKSKENVPPHSSATSHRAISHRTKSAHQSTLPTQTKSKLSLAEIRRQVWHRDQGQCQFFDPLTKRKCLSKHKIQRDHIIPRALGGEDSLQNLRLLCATHNQFEAIRVFSAKHMNPFIPGLR